MGGITGDSFVLDVRALRGGRDGYAGASRYLTMYLTKASISGSLAHELELDLRGFHLIGSWESPLPRFMSSASASLRLRGSFRCSLRGEGRGDARPLPRASTASSSF
jgi:hypothetical protein